MSKTVVTQADLLKERQVHNMIFWAALNAQVPNWISEVAGPIRMSTGKVVYKGLGAVPQMRKFVGQRMSERPRVDKYELEDEMYDLVLELTGDEFRAKEVLEIVRSRTSELQAAVGENWVVLAYDALFNNGICFDGQNYFDTDHASGKSSAQNNAYTFDVATPTAPTPAEFENAFWSGLQAWTQILDDQNRPSNENRVRSFVLVIPSTFEQAATAAFAAESLLEGGQSRTNTLRIATRLTVDIVATARPLIRSTPINDTFWVLAKDGRGLVRQQSLDAERTSLGVGSDTYHNEDRLEFGIRTKRNVGYGDWKSAWRMQLT